MGGEIRWWFEIDQSRHIPWTFDDEPIDLNKLVGLITEPSDIHYQSLVRFVGFCQGNRRHKETGLVEPCNFFYLIVDNGDHGWWEVPINGYDYRHPMHPHPKPFCRQIPDIGQPEAALIRWGCGPRDFYWTARALMENGTGSDPKKRVEIHERIRGRYRDLFGEPLILE